jgi:hypothetical protein
MVAQFTISSQIPHAMPGTECGHPQKTIITLIKTKKTITNNLIFTIMNRT